ncbi:MAG: S26 family signal peptidase [Bacteroidales bacterium]|jgi:signal peptidase I|nr:S26 family signal peptidase [Bacteroidales bacterium]
MKLKVKIIMISSISLAVIYVLLRITGLMFYNLPTKSMESTVPVRSKLVTMRMNFSPERNECIVFRNPKCDTVLIPHNYNNYYVFKRKFGIDSLKKRYKIKYVPLEFREESFGRCVGLPGDTVKIYDGNLYVNNTLFEAKGIKYCYSVVFSGKERFSLDEINRLKLDRDDIFYTEESSFFYATKDQEAKIRSTINIDTLYRITANINISDPDVFPNSENYNWNIDYFGELVIPKKGKSIALTLDNLHLYRRLIENYENNDLVVDSLIRINGVVSDNYTPKQNYYFICNDNRYLSIDSRHIGFIPENHISAKLLFTI